VVLIVSSSSFTYDWWGWLIATGVFMACTWGSKVNGILTVFTIGVAVVIDLWDLLDIKKNPTMDTFWKQFTARAFGLIVVPFIVYLSFFYVHFAILTHSGPGDSFMSPAFQETLLGNEMLLNSHGGDTLWHLPEVPTNEDPFRNSLLRHHCSQA
jgi:dolichyl-phosphate-mannose-protein mannosyltransferase